MDNGLGKVQFIDVVERHLVPISSAYYQLLSHENSAVTVSRAGFLPCNHIAAVSQWP